jgi:UDP-N-acetylglucosamine 2-epimerase
MNRRLLGAAADIVFVADEAAAVPTSPERIRMVGDPLADAVRRYARPAAARAAWERLGVESRGYVLAIVTAEEVHPRIAAALAALAADSPLLVLAPAARSDGLKPVRQAGGTLVGAAGFVDRLSLQRGAGVIVTDSDRVRREAAALGVRCEHIATRALEDVEGLRLRLRTTEPCAALLEASGAARRIASAVVTAYAPVRLGMG